MRKFFVLAAALALTACGQAPPLEDLPRPDPQEQGSVAGDAVLAHGTQALIAANNTYTVVATGVATAARAGLIPARYGPTLRELNRQINEALEAGGRAQTGADKLRAAGIVRLLTERLRSFLPGGSP